MGAPESTGAGQPDGTGDVADPIEGKAADGGEDATVEGGDALVAQADRTSASPAITRPTWGRCGPGRRFCLSCRHIGTILRSIVRLG